VQGAALECIRVSPGSGDTLANGRVEQSNFNDFLLWHQTGGRLSEVHFLKRASADGVGDTAFAAGGTRPLHMRLFAGDRRADPQLRRIEAVLA